MAKTAKDYALKGYCTWLVPDAGTSAELQQLVTELAALEPGAPTFAPHITLLSPKNALRDDAAEMEAALRSAVAAARTGPLELTLSPPAPGTFYYQCILAPVVAAPGDPLLALRKAAEESMAFAPPSFFPHVSLLYGDLSDARKAELCAAAAGRGVHFPLKIRVAEAVVVDVNGTAEEWKIVARVAL